MKKFKFNNVSRDKMLQFLRLDEREIKEGGILFLAVWSIVDFMAALFFLEYKILWGIIFLIPCVFIIGTLIWFDKKMEHSRKNKSFFMGLYSITITISFCVLSYALFKYSCGRNIYWLWLFFIVCILAVGSITIFDYHRKFDSDYYSYAISRGSGIITGLVSILVVVLRAIYSMIDGYQFVGSILALMAVLYPAEICYFFIKAYFYDFLEKEEEASKIPEDAIVFVKNSNNRLCIKGEQWLRDHNIEYVCRDVATIKLRDPEIKNWHSRSGVPISDFFDANAVAYKSMKLKERLPNMTDEEPYNMLVKNNSLLKLPIIVCADYVLIGFRENEWEEKLLGNR